MKKLLLLLTATVLFSCSALADVRPPQPKAIPFTAFLFFQENSCQLSPAELAKVDSLNSAIERIKPEKVYVNGYAVKGSKCKCYYKRLAGKRARAVARLIKGTKTKVKGHSTKEHPMQNLDDNRCVIVTFTEKIKD